MNKLIFTEPEVRQLIGCSRTQLYRMERDNKFPKKRAISENKIGWLAEEVVAWIASRPVKNPGDTSVKTSKGGDK